VVCGLVVTLAGPAAVPVAAEAPVTADPSQRIGTFSVQVEEMQ
jgi:hypothetical protein